MEKIDYVKLKDLRMAHFRQCPVWAEGEFIDQEEVAGYTPGTYEEGLVYCDAILALCHVTPAEGEPFDAVAELDPEQDVRALKIPAEAGHRSHFHSIWRFFAPYGDEPPILPPSAYPLRIRLDAGAAALLEGYAELAERDVIFEEPPSKK